VSRPSVRYYHRLRSHTTHRTNGPHCTANARVIHSLYAHTIVPTNFAEAEVIVISYGVENFHAAVVRARVFPDVKIGSEPIITMQVHNCKNTLEALEKLYELSRAKLSRAHELAANSGPGGLLGERKQLAL
jgi:predicted transcriptional regulator